MKKLMMVVGMVAILAVAAHAAEVTSVNVAGVVNVNVPAGEFRIVGINLDSIDPADANLQAIFGGQLTPGTDFNYATADKVMLWDNAGGKYNVYAIKASDGLFHDATGLPAWIGAAVNPAIGPGDAFWLNAAGAVPINASLTGQAVADATMDVTIVPGFQFVTYPLSSVVNIQDTAFAGIAEVVKGADFNYASADKLILWTGSAYAPYAVKASDSMWHDASGLPAWIGAAVDIDLDLGVGFWYEHKGAGFTWTESNLYLSNI